LRYNPNRKEDYKNPETNWLQALEQTLNQSHARVANGLFEALEWFQEQKIAPYILSHRPKEVINLYLTKISGSDRDTLLELVPRDRHITCDLVEPSRRNAVLNGAKVHADIYPDLQRITGFKPESTLVIENHLKSTLDATEHGFVTIGYTDDRCDVVCADGIRFAGAVTTFNKWDEVQDAVRSSLYSQKTGPAPQNAGPC
jgi:beta-phosphoglucomutase-like phosphatase (HAD superfamily)